MGPMIRIDDKARLYRGNSLDILPKLKPVHFIFTDPPYGHNNNNDDLIRRVGHACKNRDRHDEGRPIQNDDFDQANDLFLSSLPLWRNILKPGGYVACCCGGGAGTKAYNSFDGPMPLTKRLSGNRRSCGTKVATILLRGFHAVLMVWSNSRT